MRVHFQQPRPARIQTYTRHTETPNKIRPYEAEIRVFRLNLPCVWSLWMSDCVCNFVIIAWTLVWLRQSSIVVTGVARAIRHSVDGGISYLKLSKLISKGGMMTLTVIPTQPCQTFLFVSSTMWTFDCYHISGSKAAAETCDGLRNNIKWVSGIKKTT